MILFVQYRYEMLCKAFRFSKVFTSLALFALLIAPLNAFPWVINGLVEANVSLKRVQRFLDVEITSIENYYETVPTETALALG